MKPPFATYAGLIAVSLGFVTQAHGNDRGVRGIMVAPASCQPYAGADRAKFTGNAWTVDEVASTTLACPLSLNNVDLGGSSSDNDITKFRIHYQIPSLAIYGEVYVNLIRSEVLNGKFISSVVCGGRLIPGTYSPTETTVSCPHDVAGNGVFYDFGIILKSTYPASPPLFFGIDFP